MNAELIHDFIRQAWAAEDNNSGPIVRALEAYISLPNDSPDFDPQWAEHGQIDLATRQVLEALQAMSKDWNCPVEDLHYEILGGPDNPVLNPAGQRRTPLVLIEIPAFGPQNNQDSVLLYGHLDKQPPLEDLWSEGLAARKASLRKGKLYGRGAVDDGYSIFSAFSAVMALRAQAQAHPRCVLMIESCEETGHDDLAYYIQANLQRLGQIGLIICLDSGCGDYEHLWLTNSLRGALKGKLEIGVMREGVHSGDASGIVPSPFRIARQLLDRLEDSKSGKIYPEAFQVEISPEVRQSIAASAQVMGQAVHGKFPFLEGVQPVEEDLTELALNRSWRAQLAITGLDGIPSYAQSGNVMLPNLSLGLSLRLPPSLDCQRATQALQELLEENPPYGAKVRFIPDSCGQGWAAPKLQSWLKEALEEAGQKFYAKAPMGMGEGGSIPIMSILSGHFPQAQFMICGAAGPGSNSHGPDEFLHLDMAARLTMCVAWIVGRAAEKS